MKQFNQMTDADKKHYMKLMMEATASLVPDDAVFLLVIASPQTNKSVYGSSIQRASLIGVLRETANRLESDIREGN